MSRSTIRSGPHHRRWTRLGAVTVALGVALGAVTAPPSDAHTVHGQPGQHSGHGHHADHHGHHGHHHGHHGSQGWSGESVRSWNEIAVDTLVGLPPASGGAPSAAPIHVAMVQGAVFDALDAIGPRHYRPYLLKRRFPGRTSVDAAVAAATHAVLRDVLSTVPDFPAGTNPDREARLATLATQYADALAAVPDGRAERRGVAAGEAAAAAMLRARADDGRFAPSPWVLDPAPGHWSPLSPAALDPTPWVGGVDPFILRSSSQLRTRGPLALTSARYADELNEVKAIGAEHSTVRKPVETYIARWWQSTPTKSWNAVGRELAMREGLDALHTARLLALQDFSGADASINCWNDKYHWDFWRPWNAIPRADEDGNPATEPDAAWRPLISAPYPEHPSGHLCLDGAHTRILRMFFGDAPAGGFSITSVSTFLPAGAEPTRSFETFSGVLAEIVEARIWAGLHFRNADEQGRSLGRAAAAYVAAHALRPTRHHHH